MNALVTVQGWCPTALRPMMSGDGLLVRVPAPRHGLDVHQVLALAMLAERYGNGLIDLTARANLQIRGVREECFPSVLEGLREAGLLDARDDSETSFKIIVPPLSGLDETALLDAAALARAIEAGLRADPTFRDLPSKFGFSIDDGGALPPGDTGADIVITAVILDDGVHVAIGLGGDDLSHRFPFPTPAKQASQNPDAGDDRMPARPSAVVPDSNPTEVVSAAALRLARAFLVLRADDRRMRTLVARIGAPKILEAADLTPISVQPHGLHPEKRPKAASRGMSPGPRSSIETLASQASQDEVSGRLLGVTRRAGFTLLGVAAPFGAWTSAAFKILANAMSDAPGASLRLTPWRVLLLTGLTRDHTEDSLARMAEHGLIVATDDPRLRVSACAGAPACASATVETRKLAQALSASLGNSGRDVSLHVSGCAKGCAHPRSSSVALVGRDGSYDLVIEGSAGDLPLLLSLDSAAALRRIGEELAS